MTAEDRLRDLLRSEATTVQPSGDGLARIQARIARRRRARFWLLPSAAVATAAVAATFFVLAPDERATQTLTPGATGTPTTQPSPSASPSPAPVAGDLTGPAFWPFASSADLQNVADPVPAWLTDPVEVGTRLVRDVLELQDVRVVQTCVSCEMLGLRVGSTDVGEVQLGHYTVRGTRVFTVVGIGGTDLTVTSPVAGSAIESPTRVTGRITGVDENVNLRLVAKDGSRLAQAGAPAGSAVPWSTSLTWSNREWSTGAVLGTTGSARDGSINRVVLVPVSRSTAPTTATFAGLVDGHVALFDAETGKQVRQLTFPPAGKSDTAATWSAGTLAWVRTAGASACANELDRLDGGKASTVATSTTVRYGWPQLDPLAERLAWVETPCSGGDGGHLVLTINGAEARRYPLPSGSVVELLDVSEDGTLLVRTNDREATGPGTIGVLPADADTLDGLRPLAPAGSCYLASGAAFDGLHTSVAFETCGDKVRLVHFGEDGSRGTVEASVQAASPQSVSVRDGKVLVWLRSGEVARYADGRLTTLITNSGCSSAGVKGCVSAPDW